MDMLFDSEKNEYYCIRCSFTGTETQVQAVNAETKRRYSDRRVRITDFGPRELSAEISKPVPIKIETAKTPAKAPRRTNV